MLNVLITFDTEAYPRTADWRERGLSSELDREVFGLTPQGKFGIRYQAQLLRSCGLKGVFFVESLFASVVGLDPLRSIVNAIQDHSREVQLHVHTEWLKHIRDPLLPGHFGYNIREFSVDEQVQLIERGRRNLEACGAHSIKAFRAGNFGANLDTLHALARAGIPMDSSYNASALNEIARSRPTGYCFKVPSTFTARCSRGNRDCCLSAVSISTKSLTSPARISLLTRHQSMRQPSCAS